MSPTGSHTDALVVFMPSGKRGRFPLGTPMLKAARSLGVDIDSVCGGRGICGRCQVEVSEGEFAKLGVTSRRPICRPSARSSSAMPIARGLKAGRRLSCSSLLQGDLVIDVPPDSQVHKQVVRKRAEMRAIELDPVVRLHYVEVIEPDMHDPSGDLQRLMQALAAQWGLTGLDCDLRVIQGLQKALRQGDWTVTVAVHHGKQITAVWPGFHEQGLRARRRRRLDHHRRPSLRARRRGDVVASAGVMNPQIRFGEDLMSRVSYVMMNPGGDVEMTRPCARRSTASPASVAGDAGIDVNDILEVTFVGNPIMHHLLLGIDPTELGGAPFALASDSALTFWATRDRSAHPSERAHLRAALHRRPCRRRYRGRHPLGGAARIRTR